MCKTTFFDENRKKFQQKFNIDFTYRNDSALLLINMSLNTSLAETIASLAL